MRAGSAQGRQGQLWHCTQQPGQQEEGAGLHEDSEGIIEEKALKIISSERSFPVSRAGAWRNPWISKLGESWELCAPPGVTTAGHCPCAKPTLHFKPALLPLLSQTTGLWDALGWKGP